VVPVDDPQVPAICLVSLAISWVEEMGLRVIVADLCSSTPAARLLGVTEPGVHGARSDDGYLVVAIPDREDVTPVGPIPRKAGQTKFPSCGQELTAAFATCDLLLTLAPLDPSVGGENLATWAPGAVAMVTAGRSSWTRTHAVSEMIRLSGTRLVSGVLIGADKTDESLGVTYTPESGDGVRDVGEASSDAERFFAALDRGPGEGRPNDR
jgi:hypothetical protein